MEEIDSKRLILDLRVTDILISICDCAKATSCCKQFVKL